MLEIRKGTATKNYENTFFREFADNLKKMFDKYSLDGLLIANSECEAESRLQIDALLVTPKAVCIIDFKNFGGKITLPCSAEAMASVESILVGFAYITDVKEPAKPKNG